MSSSERPLVIYHGGCADGFCAAWAAHTVLGDLADYLPAAYGEPPPDVTDRTVCILDFSWKRPQMLTMARQANTLVVLDHHKTAQADLAGLREECVRIGYPSVHIRFDMARSGGRLAWDYFRAGEKAPWLVEWTEDRDLWLWRLPRSREVSAGLSSYPFDFATWNALALRDPMEIANEGAAVLRWQEKHVESMAKKAGEIELDGHKVLAINCTCLTSEIAGRLAENRPFGVCWFDRADGTCIWSLRSREGGVDVSEIAVKHGGGGHRNAAGFQEEKR